MIKDVFVSQAASRQSGGIAPAQPRTWCGGERAKTNYCDCFPYALLTSEFQLPGKKEEKGVRGKWKRWVKDIRRARRGYENLCLRFGCRSLLVAHLSAAVDQLMTQVDQTVSVQDLSIFLFILVTK